MNNIIYYSLFTKSKSIMLLIDPENGSIIDANESACNFYRYSKEEILKKKIQEINILSDAEVFAEMEKAKQESRNCFDFKHKLANDVIRDVQVYAGPILINNKSYLYSIVHDVTERIRTQKKLDQERALLNLIEANLPGIFFVTTENGKLVRTNENFNNVIESTAYSTNILNLVVDYHRVAFKDFLENTFINQTSSCTIKLITTFGVRDYYLNSFRLNRNEKNLAIFIGLDISENVSLLEEKVKLIAELNDKMKQIKTLSGLLPICANCKKIRDDAGYWNNLEDYFSRLSDVQFSHGICPDCMKKLYPEFDFEESEEK